MNMVVAALLAVMTLVAAQGTPTAAQEAWLKSFTGTWVIDNPVGSDADITLTVVRDGKALVLKANLSGGELVTRYDLSGVDVTNERLGRKAVYRTRIDGQKLVTEIWQNEPAGPPMSIETRYLESADRMVTELARTPGGTAFNRTVLKRKGPVAW